MSYLPNKLNAAHAQHQELKRDCLRPHEVASRLGISREQVLRHYRRKRLPGFKLGGVWLMRAEELERYLRMKEELFNPRDAAESL